MADTKTLLVYYSRTGTTRRLAEAIASELKCEVEEIQDVRSRKGLFGWLRSGREAMKRSLPEIKEPVRDPAQYKIVIVGTPVWADTMASPVRTWLDRFRPKLVNSVALFCTMGADQSGKTIPEMGSYCTCDTLASVSVSKGEVQRGEFRPKLTDFLTRIKQHGQETSPT
jgi:flavodoxin